MTIRQAGGAGLALRHLPLARHADCTVVAAAQVAWLVRNEHSIHGHWVLNELEFFADAGCSAEVSVPANVHRVIYSACPGCAGYGAGISELAIQDDQCSAQCISSERAWAGEDDELGRVACGSYVGYEFTSPVAIRCVRCGGRGCDSDTGGGRN